MSSQLKNAAIYARKSVLTGVGESIDNQIRLCRDYLQRFSLQNIYVFSDEGFSGRDTQRPMFQSMMDKASKSELDLIICYRLDRISRNIADFSNLILELDKLNIGFISLKEQFDTSTPMGRAMMYISSVFSQLERETISERIRDNMLLLAQRGRWLGGMTPTGFKSIPKISDDDKSTLYHILSPIEPQVELVRHLYDIYLEEESLSRTSEILNSRGMYTKMGKPWTLGKIRTILENPVYVKSSEDVWMYLREQGIECIGEFDGVNGIMLYNKREGKKGKYRDKSNWICSLGYHEGIVDSHSWLKVQKLLEKNSRRSPRSGSSSSALLSGMVFCSDCGNVMKVRYGSTRSDGSRNYYYVCSLKSSSKRSNCVCPNVSGTQIDNVLWNYVKSLPINTNLFKDEITPCDELPKDSLLFRKKENLIRSLSLTDDPKTQKDILMKLESLSKDLQKNAINSLPSEDKLNSIEAVLDSFTFKERQGLIQKLFSSIEWNHEDNSIYIKPK